MSHPHTPESNRRFPRGIRLFLALPGFLLFAIAAQAQNVTYTWSGGDTGISPNWSDSNNWLGNSAPVSSSLSDLVFTGITGLNNVADSSYTLDSITFDPTAGGASPGTGFDLSGGTLFFQGTAPVATITNQNTSNITQEIDNNLVFSGSNNISFASLLTNGTATAAGPIILGANGSSTLALSGTLNENISSPLIGDPELKINDTINGTGVLNISTDHYITTLSGTNSGYNGQINLQGFVVVTNSNALGNGTLNINTSAATASLGAPTGTSLTFSNPITLGNNNSSDQSKAFNLGVSVTSEQANVYSDTGTITLSGPISLLNQGNKTISVAANTTAVITGAITAVSGTTGLQIGVANNTIATGTLILSEPTSNFGGGVTLPSKMMLVVGNNGALGSGTLSLGGTTTTTGNSSPTIAGMNGPITLSNSVIFESASAQTPTTTFGNTTYNSPLTFTGTTTLTQATASLAAAAGIVTTFQGPITQLTGSTSGLTFKASSNNGSNGGTFVLAGSNSYTGINTLSPGTNGSPNLNVTVQVTNPFGLGLNTTGSAIAMSPGATAGGGALDGLATLSLLNDGTGNNGTIIYGPGSGYSILVTSSSAEGNIINVDHLATATGNTIQLGLLTMTGGNAVLNINGGDGYGLAFANGVNWNSTYTINNSVPLTLSGTTGLNGTASGRTDTFEGSAPVTITGVVGSTTGNQTFSVNGTGALVILDGSTTWSSGFYKISNGTLQVNNGLTNGLGNSIVILGGATLEAATSFTLATSSTITNTLSTIQVDPGQTLTISGTIAGGGVLNKTGAGTLALTGTQNTYSGSGGTAIFSGTLAISGDGSLGNATKPITLFGGALLTSATISTARAVAVSGGGIIDTGVNTFTISGGISGSTALAKAGAGVLSVSGAALASTFNGTLTVTAGRVELNNNNGTNAFGPGANVVINSGGEVRLIQGNQINQNAILTLAGGTFNSNGNSDTIGSLTLQTGVSTFDFGSSGSSTVQFSDSSFNGWSGTLSILDWNGLKAGGGADQLFIGTFGALLTNSQLLDITFLNPAGFSPGTYSALQLTDGEIVAVPEPGTWLIIISGVGLLGLSRRFRRFV